MKTSCILARQIRPQSVQTRFSNSDVTFTTRFSSLPYMSKARNVGSMTDDLPSHTSWEIRESMHPLTCRHPVHELLRPEEACKANCVSGNHTEQGAS